MAPAKPDLLQGTLDLLILKTLRLEPNHGWGISQRIQQLSQDVLAVNQGSLYPALGRLEEQGLIEAEWGVSENNRRARFYNLTRTGRRQLETPLTARRGDRSGVALPQAIGRVCGGAETARCARAPSASTRELVTLASGSDCASADIVWSRPPTAVNRRRVVNDTA